MTLFLRILTTVFLLLLPPIPSTAAASPTLLLNGSSDSHQLIKHLDILFDNDGKLSISKIFNAHFMPLPGELKLSVTPAAVWLRFSVDRRADDPREWWLELDQPMLEDIQLFEVEKNGPILRRQGQAGKNLPWKEREVDYRNVIFKLQLPQTGIQTFFLRLSTHNPMSAKLTLWQPQSFINGVIRETAFYGLYYGIIVAILLLQSGFWYCTKDPLSPTYIAYLLLIVCNSLLAKGWMQQFLPPAWLNYVDTLGHVGLCLMLAVSAFFWSKIYGLSKTLPRFNRFYLYGLSSIALSSALLTLPGYRDWALQLLQMVALPNFVVLLLLPLYLILHNRKSIWYYWAAFAFVNIDILVKSLNKLGILNTFSDSHLTEIGIVLHLGLISFGIFHQYQRIALNSVAAKAVLRQAAQQHHIERTSRKAQSDFMVTISHQLYVPLTTIDTSARKISHTLCEPFEHHAHCANIKHALDHLHAILNNLPSLERPEVDNPAPHYAPGNLEKNPATALMLPAEDFPQK